MTLLACQLPENHGASGERAAATPVKAVEESVQAKPARKLLGEITIPSGVVLVVDSFDMDYWSSTESVPTPPYRAPGLSEDLDPMQDFDLQVVGPDAMAAGVAWGRTVHPLYFNGVARKHVAGLIDRFATHAKAAGLDARLEVLEISPAEGQRVKRLLADGFTSRGFGFQGVEAGLVQGMPKDRRLPVYRGLPDSSSRSHKSYDVYIELVPGAKVVRSESRGFVAVEHGVVMFADVDAADAWVIDTHLRPALDQMHTNAADSWTLSVGGADICVFYSNSDDSTYEVLAEYDAGGELVRVRIAFDDDEPLE